MRILLIALSLLISISSFGQKKEYDFHKTIIEIGASHEISQTAKDPNGIRLKYDSQPGVNLKYTNAFFVKPDLSIGLALGLETGPVSEIPVTLNARKYFNNKYFLSSDLGKTFYASADFKTWLFEFGGGRLFKLGKKSNLSVSANYQFTYLNNAYIEDKFFHADKYADYFIMHSAEIRVGIHF